MEKLFEIQNIILDAFEREPLYERAVYNTLTLDNYITGIMGPRGIGKTTFLLKQALQSGAKTGSALYISADNIYFLDHSLLDLVDQLYKETDVRLLCIDEVHKYPRWNQELKNIADTYREFRILFSGSSTIDIIHSKYDLSRRVTLHTLHGFSFREYLEINLDINLPTYSLQELIACRQTIGNDINIKQPLKYFKDYLKIGYYPFFRRFQVTSEKYQAIENATQKTIYEDIAVLHQLKTPTLLILEKLFQYVVNSLPGELNINKLATALHKDHNNIAEHLNILQRAGLLRFIQSKKSKMYPDNTNLIYANYLSLPNDVILGKTRETFVVNQLQNAGYPIHYSKTGDFIVDNTLFEVGGKNKTTQQIKNQNNAYLLLDDHLHGGQHMIPLYLLGFLY